MPVVQQNGTEEGLLLPCAHGHSVQDRLRNSTPPEARFSPRMEFSATTPGRERPYYLRAAVCSAPPKFFITSEIAEDMPPDTWRRSLSSSGSMLATGVSIVAAGMGFLSGLFLAFMSFTSQG